MKELLNLWTKNVHFTFKGKIYVQNDDVEMGLPLGSVLANIFMVEFEQLVIPTLMDKMKCWAEYEDGTLCYIKAYSIEYVLNVFSSQELMQKRVKLY